MVSKMISDIQVALDFLYIIGPFSIKAKRFKGGTDKADSREELGKGHERIRAADSLVEVTRWTRKVQQRVRSKGHDHPRWLTSLEPPADTPEEARSDICLAPKSL